MTTVAPLARLQDVAALNPPLGAVPANDEVVSFLPMSAVDADAVDAVDIETRLFHEVSKSYTPFVSDDVLVAKITPCFENGKIAQAKPTRRFGFGSTEFHVIRPHPRELDPRYLVHFLRQGRVRREGERKMTGSAGQRRVPEHFLANLRLPLPPLPKQRRIAQILDKADALRARRRGQVAQFDTLTQSIFLDVFGDPATNPRGWPIVPLGDVMTEVYRYPTYYDISYVDDGVPEIRGELLNEDGTVVTERSALRFISPETSYRFPRTVLSEGDLVMSVRGTVGKIAVVPAALTGANMTANLLRLAPDRAQVLPTYAWHYMRTTWFRQQLAKACSNTTIQTIKAPDVKRISVLRPAIELQRDFARMLACTRGLKSLAVSGMAGLNSLFASLQHRAFQGEP